MKAVIVKLRNFYFWYWQPFWIEGRIVVHDFERVSHKEHSRVDLFNLAEWIQMIFCQNQIKLHIYFRQVRKTHYI